MQFPKSKREGLLPIAIKHNSSDTNTPQASPYNTPSKAIVIDDVHKNNTASIVSSFHSPHKQHDKLPPLSHPHHVVKSLDNISHTHILSHGHSTLITRPQTANRSRDKSDPHTLTHGHSVLMKEKHEYNAKIIYSGSMLFWKDDIYVEVDIVHHISADIIEVCAFSIEAHKEAVRAYISIKNKESILTLIPEKSIEDNTATGKLLDDESNHSRLLGVIVGQPRQEADAENKALIDILLARINVSYENDSHLVISITAGTLHLEYAVVDKPVNVKAYAFKRAKPLSKFEYEEFVSAVHADLLQASLCVDKASEYRMRSMVGLIVRSMRTAVKESKLLKERNDSRSRWMYSMNTVMRHLSVSKYRTKMGLSALAEINGGDVIVMDDTRPLAEAVEMSRVETEHRRRLSRYKSDMFGSMQHIDGVTVNVHKEYQ